MRVPAGDIEGLVLDRLRAFLSSTGDVGDALGCIDLGASELEAVFDRARRVAEGWLTQSPVEHRTYVRSIVEKVIVEADRIIVHLSRSGLLTALGAEPSADGTKDTDRDPMILTIDASLRRAGKGKRLVIGNGMSEAVDPGLARLLAEARAVRNELLSGPDDSIEAMTERLGLAKGRLTALVRLSYVAPEIVHAILSGRQPVELTPTRLIRLSKDLPHDWAAQHRFLGFAD